MTRQSANRRRIERSADLESRRRELERTDRELDNAIQAIPDGVPRARLKDKIGTLEARKTELTELLANAQEPSAPLHPNMAEVYHQKTAALYGDLQGEDTKAQAAEMFRSLVSQVDVVPEAGTLTIYLRGDLAAILRFVAGKKTPTSFRKPGFWMTCYRKHRWLRGRATISTCVVSQRAILC